MNNKAEIKLGELIFSLIVGLLIVLSVPALKEFFVNLIGTIFAVILLAVFVGAVIFVVWLLIEKYNERGI